VGGSLALGGTLDVNLLYGFRPQPGQTFDILDSSPPACRVSSTPSTCQTSAAGFPGILQAFTRPARLASCPNRRRWRWWWWVGYWRSVAAVSSPLF